MTLSLVITNAGRAAITTAQSNGTNAITIAKVGVTASVFTPLATQTALPGEIKQLTAVSGGAIAPATIHLSAIDASSDVYDLHGFALYLSDNTLFAIYSQAAVIQSKAAGAQALLSGDIVFSDLGAVSVTVGDTTFLNPPATTEVQGVVELATSAETIAKTDTTRAVTVKGLWDAFSNWIATAMAGVWTSANDGAGSGLDADLLDGQHAAYFLPAASYTAADIKAKLITVDGAGSSIDADLLDGQQGSYYTAIAARLGYTPVDAADYTAADVLTKLKTVDGSGSGVDADLLDGQHGSYYTAITARLGYTPLDVADFTASDVLTKLKTVDGSGSGIDADLLDGQQGSYYTAIAARLGYTPVQQGTGVDQTTNSVKIGWSAEARLKATVDASDQGNFVMENTLATQLRNYDGSGSGIDADLLDGQHGAYYLPAFAYTTTDVKTRMLSVDGSGSGLDADLLDGQHGAYYLAASSYSAADVLTKLKTVDGSGSGIDADLLDGYQAAAFALLALTNANLPVTQNANGTCIELGNLVIQMGMVLTVVANDQRAVTFPVPFDNVPFFSFAGTRVGVFAANSDSSGQVVGTPSKTGMTVANCTVARTIDIPWFAIALK